MTGSRLENNGVTVDDVLDRILGDPYAEEKAKWSYDGGLMAFQFKIRGRGIESKEGGNK